MLLGLRDRRGPSAVPGYEWPWCWSDSYRHAPSELRYTPTNGWDEGFPVEALRGLMTGIRRDRQLIDACSRNLYTK
jgi:hypothetical protein